MLRWLGQWLLSARPAKRTKGVAADRALSLMADGPFYYFGRFERHGPFTNSIRDRHFLPAAQQSRLHQNPGSWPGVVLLLEVLLVLGLWEPSL